MWWSCFTRELSFCLLVKEFLKLVDFWRSYRQNGLIASHALFEVHCQAGQCMANIHLLQGFSSAIRQTFVQYFYQVSTDSALARSLGDSWASSSPVKLHYYGRRIIVTPFVNKQFILQVVERGRAVSSLSSPVQT